MALAERGHDVDVFAPGDADSLPESADHDRLSVTFVGERRRALVTFETLYYSLLTRQRVDFDAYDVIHGTLMPASPVALAVRLPSTSLVVTSHGTSLGEVRSHKLEVATDYPKKLFFHPLNVVMDMVTASRAERVIAISEDSRDELARRYPVSRDALVHVPHGVDADRFPPEQSPHEAT